MCVEIIICVLFFLPLQMWHVIKCVENVLSYHHAMCAFSVFFFASFSVCDLCCQAHGDMYIVGTEHFPALYSILCVFFDEHQNESF
jgi:hypothetical protein